MTKPLELTVYPKPRYTLTTWRYQADPFKRFTDTELAAEFWAAFGDANAAMTGNPPLRFGRRAVLHRFATLPHYDEPTP